MSTYRAGYDYRPGLKSGPGIAIDTRQLSSLARGLRRAGSESRAVLRGTMREAGELVAAEARKQSAFSTRIPGSITVLAAGGNFRVRAGGPAAPDAAPIENEGKGFVRHPVFGNREAWTDKNSHPAYLAPALEAKAEEVVELVTDRLMAAVEAALRS